MKSICHILVAAFLLTTTRADAAQSVSMSEAKKVALAKVPGTVVHEKLKHPKKKGHDYYSIKIKPRDHAKAGYVKKVEVDKETGQILEIKDVKAKASD